MRLHVLLLIIFRSLSKHMTDYVRTTKESYLPFVFYVVWQSRFSLSSLNQPVVFFILLKKSICVYYSIRSLHHMYIFM